MYRKMTGRLTVVRPYLAVAWIFRDVVAAHNRRTVKRRREHRRRTRMPKILERLAWGSRQRVKRELFALVVDDVVEKGSELRTGELRCRVGYRLDDALEIQLGRQRDSHLV